MDKHAEAEALLTRIAGMAPGAALEREVFLAVKAWHEAHVMPDEPLAFPPPVEPVAEEDGEGEPEPEHHEKKKGLVHHVKKHLSHKKGKS